MRKIFRLLARRIEAKDLYRRFKPYDYLSSVAIQQLSRYTRTPEDQIKRVCIVGVHNGFEVPPLLKKYPNVHVHLYEASARYQAKLRRKFGANPRVTLRPAAASDTAGKLTFFETSLHGNGSLLPIDTDNAIGVQAAEETQVDTVRLDDDYPSDGCDMLWIDVQGAEMQVLKGAETLLKRTNSVFIEVSRVPMGHYQGGCTMDQVVEYLAQFDLHLVLLGLDGEEGNAYFNRIQR